MHILKSHCLIYDITRCHDTWNIPSRLRGDVRSHVIVVIRTRLHFLSSLGDLVKVEGDSASLAIFA